MKLDLDLDLYLRIIFSVVALPRINTECVDTLLYSGMGCPYGHFVEGPNYCLWHDKSFSPWHEAKQRCKNVYPSAQLAAMEDKNGTILNKVLKKLNLPIDGLDLWVRIPQTSGRRKDQDDQSQCVKRSHLTGTRVLGRCKKRLAHLCTLKIFHEQKPALILSPMTSGGGVEAICNVRAKETVQINMSLSVSSPDKSEKDQCLETSLSGKRHVTRHKLTKGVCKQIIEVRSKVPILHGDYEASVSCCLEYTSGYHTCTPSEVIPEAYKPRKPVLNVNYVKSGTSHLAIGHYLYAECHAPIGYSDYEVTWELRSRTGNTAWILDQDGGKWLVLGSESDPVLTSANVLKSTTELSSEELHGVKGPIMLSTFTLPVTESLRGAVLSCSTSPRSTSHLETNILVDLTTESHEFTLIYLPETPHLTIPYDVEPDGVFNDTILLAHCRARVGTGGALVWVLDETMSASGHKWHHTWRVKFGQENADDHDLVASVTSISINTADGPEIRSTLRLNIQLKPERFDGAILSCVSEETGLTRGNLYEGHRLLRHSLPLRILFKGDENIHDYVYTRIQGLSTEPQTSDTHWDDDLSIHILFLASLFTLLANYLWLWTYLPNESKQVQSTMKRAVDETVATEAPKNKKADIKLRRLTTLSDRKVKEKAIREK